MSSLDRFMEYLTAAIFLCVGLKEIWSYRRRPKALGAAQTRLPFGFPREALLVIGLLEIVAALALVVPFGPWSPAARVGLAALILALLTIIGGIDHVRRHLSVAPAAVLLLLTLFVLVGRWEQLPTWFSF
jgi:predicted membrane protein